MLFVCRLASKKGAVCHPTKIQATATAKSAFRRPGYGGILGHPPRGLFEGKMEDGGSYLSIESTPVVCHNDKRQRHDRAARDDGIDACLPSPRAQQFARMDLGRYSCQAGRARYAMRCMFQVAASKSRTAQRRRP